MKKAVILSAMLVSPAIFAEETCNMTLCQACHETTLGPSLENLKGRISGTLEGFEYSEAMKAKAVVWDRESLDKFLTDPQAFIPGTTMGLPPMSDEQARKNVLCAVFGEKA